MPCDAKLSAFLRDWVSFGVRWSSGLVHQTFAFGLSLQYHMALSVLHHGTGCYSYFWGWALTSNLFFSCLLCLQCHVSVTSNISKHSDTFEPSWVWVDDYWSSMGFASAEISASHCHRSRFELLQVSSESRSFELWTVSTKKLCHFWTKLSSNVVEFQCCLCTFRLSAPRPKLGLCPFSSEFFIDADDHKRGTVLHLRVS